MTGARRMRLGAVAGALVLAALVPALLGDGSSALGGVREVSAGQAASARFTLRPGRLDTALLEPALFDPGRNADLALARTRAAGARAVRLILYWRFVAPAGTRKPAGFDASNPSDRAYRWESFDRQVRLATRYGLEPIVGVQLAPDWAERGQTGAGAPGTRMPDPAELARFATAAAIRYSGRFSRLPRVRYWQVWNEPNLNLFLTPQSPELYRELVNAFSDAVRAVRSDSRVIAGGLTPFGFRDVAAPPMPFMRDLLCMSAGARPRPTCSHRIRFDIWSHHPYTTGGPTRKAQNAGDASLGDLPEMRRLLEAAVRSGRIRARGPLQFWVTEFSWDSSPPDPDAVPAQLHARWVAEAMYRMWQSGVSLVTWFQLRDDPLQQTQFQSGLYLYDGPSFRLNRPKLALRAFRFPFVAFASRGGVSVWGRAPRSARGVVIVERQAGRRWVTLARVDVNRYGVFERRFRGTLAGPLRARLASRKDTSVPFSLTRPADLQVWPFGCGGVLACK